MSLKACEYCNHNICSTIFGQSIYQSETVKIVRGHDIADWLKVDVCSMTRKLHELEKPTEKL